MTEQNRPDDPLEQLRRADPVHSSPAPSDSKARIWARIEEVTMEDTKRSGRRTAAWGGALAAAAVAGVAAVALLLNPGDAADPAPTDGGGTAIGSCVETYSLETLGNREFAFDGTVTALDGEDATFDVNESFAGESAAGESVTLNAGTMTGTTISSAGGETLVVGQRYLVAGDDNFAWACGFTQPYDAAVAAEWAEAAR